MKTAEQPQSMLLYEAKVELSNRISMSLYEAKAELSARIYEATRMIEDLEHCRAESGARRIRGNGHHIRQQIVAFAADLLEERWQE